MGALERRSPQRLIPIGTLVSNVGNGMYLLAVGVLLYEHFGSATTFAWLLVLQSVVVLATQALASVGADGGYSKFLASRAEFVRGILVAGGAIAVALGQPFALLPVGLLLALLQPFYRTSIFALGPLVARGDGLARYNARTATFQQVGQFLGAAVAGALMQVSDLLPLCLNAVSYLFSGLMVVLAVIPGQSSRVSLRVIGDKFHPRSVSREWVQGARELWQTQNTLRLTLLCAADLVVINWLNSIYAPLLAQYGVDRIWISWWDTLYAAGAVIGANLVGRVPALRSSFMVIPIVLALEGIAVTGVGAFGALMTGPVMVVVGIVNAGSVALFTYFIQMSARVEMAGRASGVRQLAIATSVLVALPGLSAVANRSVALSGQVLCVVLLATAGIAFVALRGRVVVGVSAGVV